jgi:hypothetical protein
MAEEKKSRYPLLPIAHWWTLRKKFKQSIPGVVTDNYIATVLNMRAESARGNVLPYLKTMGIIDDEGKTGERAKKWRDDDQYAEVCKAILSEVYPQELLDAVPDPTTDRDRAEKWFANKTGTGEQASRKMATLYTVITAADASKQPDDKTEKHLKPKSEKKASSRPPAIVHPPAPAATHSSHQQPPTPTAPGIHINLEIHISADSTPDQIDSIFASMAKHIYKR